MAIQLEMEDDEGMQIADELLTLADGLESRLIRHQAERKRLGLHPGDPSPTEARIVLMRHFGQLVVELVKEAREWRPTT